MPNAVLQLTLYIMEFTVRVLCDIQMSHVVKRTVSCELPITRQLNTPCLYVTNEISCSFVFLW